MESFIGVKLINAMPMTVGDARDEHDVVIKFEGDEATEGYLVEYPDGFKSWCPKKQFEEANRPGEAMPFGMAVECARKGAKIARSGWNGKGMFVVYQKGYPEGIPCNENTAEAFGVPVGSLHKVRPYLVMRCADGTHQMWLASQSDILEDDWIIIN